MAGRLGDIFVQRGWLTEEQLQSVLQSGQKGMLGDLLVARGFINQEQLGEALTAQFDVPFRDVVPEDIHQQIVRLLPETLARNRSMAPVSV
jgi:hypothetical protein